MAEATAVGQSNWEDATTSAIASDDASHPLCVDLDGTLIKSDLLIEGVLLLLRRNVLYLFLIPLWLLKGRAGFKAEIARRVSIDPALLPYSRRLIAFLSAEKARGRMLVLATASHVTFASRVADHLGFFDEVLASDDETNLSGTAKLARIRELLGDTPFDYAGNDHKDLAIFREAAGALLVNPAPGVRGRAVRDGCSIVAEFDEQPRRLRDYLKAMRLHQWLKNGLIALPLLLSHKFIDLAALQQTFLAFLAFGLCASSVYVLNDLLDLADDRRHPDKRHRPFASGAIPIPDGFAMASLLLAAAGLLTLLLPFQFAVVLVAYYAMTLGYSFFFKRTLLFDVIVLAALYTSRIVAGSAALDIPRSPWLLAFSVFVFFSLALVKRYVELGQVKDVTMELSERARGYRQVDRETLAQFGIASGLMSVLVLALYIDSDRVRELYAYPEVIWLLCPLMLYLITRIWVLARRDEMSADPVLFAIRDWRSQVVVGIGAILLLVAAL